MWKKSPTATAPVNPPTPVVQQNNSVIPKIQNVPNWKSYAGGTRNFTFWYPQEWVVSEGADKNSLELWSPKTLQQQVDWKNKGTIGEGPQADIVVSSYSSVKDIPNNTEGKSLEQYFKESGFFSDVQPTVFAGQSAWFAVQTDSFVNFYTLYAEHNGNVYQLSFHGNTFDTPMTLDKMSDTEKQFVKNFQLNK